MSRNNEDRLGATMIDAEAPPQATGQLNPTPNNNLSFVAPTEFVEIPSGGAFYPEGHSLHRQTCIEIKHMTAKEEDILSDKALLKKGLAIDRFLKSVIIDKDINVDSLLVGDKNAILVAARITGYGAEYDTKLICPVCFAHGRQEFDLTQCEVNDSESLEENEVELTQNGTFLLTPPKTGVSVECKLFTGKEEKNLLAAIETRKKNKLPSADLTTQLKMMIVSVNGETDRQYINSFVENIPASDSRHLRATYQKCVPNVSLRQTYCCSSCEAETEIEVPFTSDFFWPNT